MTRPCFIVCLIGLIIIPRNVHSFFNIPVAEIIEPTGSLACYLNSTGSVNNEFQLCAIRVYTPQSTADEAINSVVQNGMWFTNIFHQLIQTRNCTGFSNMTDIGTGICAPMPYETAGQMILCICATSNCNQNLEACQASNQETFNTILLPRSLPILTSTVACRQTSEVSDACYDHLLINTATCDMYMKSHSVLCTIGDDGFGTIQNALIEENYEAFLVGILHALKPVINAFPTNPLIETQTYVHYMYYPDAVTTAQQCACTQSPDCNFNITTCAPTVTMTSTQSSMIFSTDITSIRTSDAPMSSMTTESNINGTMTMEYTTAVPVTTTATTGLSPVTTITSHFTATTVDTAASVIFTITSSSMTITGTMENMTRANVQNPASEGSNLSIGAIIGIIVGVAVALTLCIALICCQCIRAKLCPCSNRSGGYRV